VTDGDVVGHVYHTYTFDHNVEGLALAAAGLIGFRLTKKPLSKLGRVPDIDSLYNPAVFYGTRGLVVGVTDLYAAVDRATVAGTHIFVNSVTNPDSVYERLVEEEGSSPLRAGIGFSILVLAVFVTAALLVLA